MQLYDLVCMTSLNVCCLKCVKCFINATMGIPVEQEVSVLSALGLLNALVKPVMLFSVGSCTVSSAEF